MRSAIGVAWFCDLESFRKNNCFYFDMNWGAMGAIADVKGSISSPLHLKHLKNLKHPCILILECFVQLKREIQMSNPLVQPLNLTAHERLEKSLGYESQRRWVAFYWEPDINQFIYNDGKNIGTGSTLAWQVFLQHPQVNPAVENYALSETDKYWLLLDRESRNLYVGEAKAIQNLLENPESLAMLAGLDGNSNFLDDTKEFFQGTVEKITQSNFLGSLKPLLPIGGVLAAIATAGMAVSLFTCPKSQKTTTLVPQQEIVSKPEPPCGLDGTLDFSMYKTGNNKTSQALHLIGVYEARGDHGMGHHPTGKIKVHLTEKKQPIILALSAYEPVEWIIDAEPGVVIKEIILNGYHDQNVVGVENIPIQEYSYKETGQYLGNFIYQWNFGAQKGQNSLVDKLEQLTGSQLTSFQGCYRGTSFQVK